MQAFFCDGCSRRVTEGELADGDGLRVGDLVLCRACCERPEVREHLQNAAAAEAGPSRGGGAPGPSQSGREHAVGRRTPHHGHRRVRPTTPRAKTTRVKRSTPRPVRPVSPVPSRPAGPSPAKQGVNPVHGHRTPHRLQKVLPRKSGTQFVLYGLVGIVVGFIVVAAASALVEGHGGRPQPKALQVRWTEPEAASEDEVRFEGEFTVPAGIYRDGRARLYLDFPSGGQWNVSVNGKAAPRRKVLDGRRALVGPVLVGRAGDWLKPGANTIRAAREGGRSSPPSGETGETGEVSPPKLLVEQGR